ncbi:MAG: HAMP domain-containing histidine kinase [Methylothermaceae bacterium]|nr:HAMP domain-containing histidine kinase [Methylothermaceae bacterium]
MKRYRFPSLFTLLLVSFVLVLLPLLLALGSALYSLEKLTGYSQAAVYRSVRSTHGSRVLLEHLVAMERSAKQYLVLSDEALFDHYRASRETFVAELRGLREMVQENDLNRLLAKLEGYEFDLYATLLDPRLEMPIKMAAADQFPYLRQLANQIWQLSIQAVGKNLEALEKQSQQSRQQTIRHLRILLPVAVLLLIFFSFLIIRPIRQLDGAIRNLGDRGFEQPISVQGPRDLEALGRRLDWLRTRLRMLEAEKQRFMRNISHELKTPLANIHEGIELLDDQVVGELTSEQAEIVQILSDNAGKLYRMIEDLIRYSQLQRLEEMIRPQKIDMKSLVEEVIDDYRVRLRANEIRLESRLASVKLNGFADLLRSMVDNLLSNAVKYSPRGSKIKVALFQKEGMMYIEVGDEGPGIPSEERKRVFDALYQGATGRKLGIEGTGLGLTIVNECAVMHHGQVEILDPSTGTGTCFRVVIPVNGDRLG